MRKATLFWGVILPIVALGTELIFQLCRNEFLDPIPSIFHQLAVLLVPISVFLVGRKLASNQRIALAIPVLNGGQVGVSLFYTIVFAPTMLLGLFFSWLGLGLLLLSPLASLVVGLSLARQLHAQIPRFRNVTETQGESDGEVGSVITAEKQLTRREATMAFSLAFLVTFSGLLLPLIPDVITDYYMRQVASGDSALRQEGLNKLRSYGSLDRISEKYNSPIRYGTFADMLDKPRKFSVIFDNTFGIEGLRAEIDFAREVYFLVSGNSFRDGKRSEPDAKAKDVDGFVWDMDSSNIGPQVPELSLHSSRLDGTLEGGASIGYIEWTLEFANSANVPEEGRMTLNLPPGGVVSRATLWVDGEPRDGVFAATNMVKKAYEQVVVVEARDPLLVTYEQPDQVFVQFFPVPSGNGKLKLKLGITYPATILEISRVRFELPRIVDGNFYVSSDLVHSIWLEGDVSIEAESSLKLTSEVTSASKYNLHGQVPESVYSKNTPTLEMFRASSPTNIYSSDPSQSSTYIKGAIVPTREYEGIAGLIVVIDSSITMGQYRDSLLSILRTHPLAKDAKYILASEHEPSINDISQVETSWQPRFGIDNRSALQKALVLASNQPNLGILWIHGHQPFELEMSAALEQALSHRAIKPIVYSLSVDGSNSDVIRGHQQQIIAKEIPREVSLTPATGCKPQEDCFNSNTTGISATLLNFLELVIGKRTTYTMSYERSTVLPTEAIKATDHLAQLWAYSEVEKELRKNQSDLQRASELASEYRIVTPVTGAVVLETAQQYKNAGLTPPGDLRDAAIPEPSTFLLMIVAAMVLLYGQRVRSAEWE